MKSLQDQIGYQFKNVKLLEQAVTHRSYSAAHNERLEFLGDSVLNLSISIRLFEELTTSNEGDLSRIRAHLVRETTLFQLAMQKGLNTYLKLGEGELRSGGKQRPSIVADALEAIIGAIYLDAGFELAQKFVYQIFEDEFSKHSCTSSSWGKDPKTALQEWLQSCRLQLPTYTVSATHGALHEQTFEINCEVSQLGVSAIGNGASKRLAEQDAAEKVLTLLKAEYGEAPKRIKIVNK